LLLAPDPQITSTIPAPPEPEPEDTPPEERSVSKWPPPPSPASGWIDILVGEPAPQNLFCIKANLKSVPYTSEIPYTLDPSFTRAINHFVDTCAALPPNSPLPPWPA
ncbi:MAG: hypothetical protein ACTHN5_14790, partial [Phycisphaerae bacterium]